MTDGLDAAWRRDGGRLIAALARRFRDIDLAEECLAEAAARAQAAWTEAPSNPSGWLYKTALRIGIDRLRSKARRPMSSLDGLEIDHMADDPETPDDRLSLYFLCCHPALSQDSQVALMLRLVTGLSVERIAKSFLAEPATILQRITRAKAKIVAAVVPFDAPPRTEWPGRMPSLLAALSIIYDQSYADVGGGVEAEALAREAATLAETLAALSDDAEAWGLAAVIRFCESRRPARIDAAGAMVPLDEQDVRLWRHGDIAMGAEQLSRAARRHAPGPWQIKALLHASHARRAETGQTPWSDIANLYDALMRLDPSPVVALNRALARAHLHGIDAALKEVDALNAEGALEAWLPFQAARADLLRRLKRREEACTAYRRALDLSPGLVEERFLRRRLEEASV